MLLRTIIAALLVAVLVFLGLGVWHDDGGVAIYAVPPLLAAAMLYVFRPQIEWSLQMRQPRDLEPELVRMFETRLPPWYVDLDAPQRLCLRERTALLMKGFDFRVQSAEERNLPDDLAAILVSQASRLSLLTGTLIPAPFETVVLYRHPFPSPQFPKHLHHSEIFVEDGVLMFALPLAIPGVMESKTYFNIVLYEFVRVYNHIMPKSAPLEATIPPWPEAVAAVVGAEPHWVSGAVGLSEIDNWAVIVVLWLDFPAAFAKTFPELADELSRHLVESTKSE